MVFIAIALAPLTLQSDTMAMYGDAFNLVTSNVNSGRNRIFDYSNYWYGETGTVEERASNAQTLTNHYYDLVTDFFEYGWGQSFHFAPRFLGEAFDASLARHEYWLATKIGLRPGFKALDVGCGVGGPMRAIARYDAVVHEAVENFLGCERSGPARLSLCLQILRCQHRGPQQQQVPDWAW